MLSKHMKSICCNFVCVDTYKAYLITNSLIGKSEMKSLIIYIFKSHSEKYHLSILSLNYVQFDFTPMWFLVIALKWEIDTIFKSSKINARYIFMTKDFFYCAHISSALPLRPHTNIYLMPHNSANIFFIKCRHFQLV